MDMDSGMVRISSYPLAAATIASPMPVLPLQPRHVTQRRLGGTTQAPGSQAVDLPYAHTSEGSRPVHMEAPPQLLPLEPPLRCKPPHVSTYAYLSRAPALGNTTLCVPRSNRATDGQATATVSVQYLVGSTSTVLPGLMSPRFSASLIMLRPMRSFTLPEKGPRHRHKVIQDTTNWAHHPSRPVQASPTDGTSGLNSCHCVPSERDTKENSHPERIDIDRAGNSQSFHAPVAGLHALELGQDGGLGPDGDAVEAHQRRPPDQLRDVVRHLGTRRHAHHALAVTRAKGAAWSVRSRPSRIGFTRQGSLSMLSRPSHTDMRKRPGYAFPDMRKAG
jgi:hypothetical protein